MDRERASSGYRLMLFKLRRVDSEVGGARVDEGIKIK